MDPCGICIDNNRATGTLCVVEQPLDVVALEKTSSFDGIYHVLHGSISPMNGIGPEDLKIKALLLILFSKYLFRDFLLYYLIYVCCLISLSLS